MVHPQQLLRKAQIALACQELPSLHTHLCLELALPLRHLSACEFQLVRCHANASGSAAIQVERQRQARRHVVVRASDTLLHAEIEHRIRAQSGLPQSPLRNIHAGAGSLEVWVVR